jgi:predicted PurR-regulated permease PerM
VSASKSSGQPARRGSGAKAAPSPALDLTTEADAPPAARLHLWQIQGVRDALVLLAVFLIVYVGYWMRDVTVPLLIALALAYLFEPLVQSLCRVRGVTRPIAVLILLVTVGLGVSVISALTATVAIGQTVKLINRIRGSDFHAITERAIEYAPEQYRDDLRKGMSWLEGGLDARVDEPPRPTAILLNELGGPPPDPEQHRVAPTEDSPAIELPPTTLSEEARIRAIVRSELAAQNVVPDPLAEPEPAPASGAPYGAPWRLLGAIGSTAERVLRFAFGLLQLSIIVFLVPFYFYFFSVSFPRLVEFGRSLVPERNRERTVHLVSAMDRAVSGFVRGRIVIAAIMGILFAFGWWICGVPYAVALGLFVGALSLVPYLGGIGVPIAVGLLLFDQLQLDPSMRWPWWAIVLWPTVVFIIVQSFEGYVLTPIIAGKVTDLDPVTIVVAILAGGSVAGVYGMLLAIPIAACAKILLKEVVLPSIRAWARGETKDPLPLDAFETDPEAPTR